MLNQWFKIYIYCSSWECNISGTAFIKGYCCSYNTAYDKTATGFDCAIIPSPSKTGGTSLAIAYEGFCGGELSTIASSIVAKTVCCKCHKYF